MHAVLGELASHPISAVLSAFLIVRRGGHWPGPALLGFLLGWGSLPLVLLLSREVRPEVAGEEQGFIPSEKAEGGSDWDEWRSYYYNLRQDLVAQALLLLVALLYVGFVASFQLFPWLVVDALNEAGWAAQMVGLVLPGLTGLLLLGSYRVPWLGPVWRCADEIWRNSGLEVPAEVHWRQRGKVTRGQEEARLALLEAVSRSHRLHQLTVATWTLMLAGLGLMVFFSLLSSRH